MSGCSKKKKREKNHAKVSKGRVSFANLMSSGWRAVGREGLEQQGSVVLRLLCC